MTILLLTTETLHHAAFVRAISEQFGKVYSILETGAPSFPFPTAHQFERDRESHESSLWFNSTRRSVTEFSEATIVESVNCSTAINFIKELSPSITIVFGTRKLSKDLISVCKTPILNLHGGDPQEYRGLDSHLWAIYHKDFTNLKTTLHWVNPTLDDGEIAYIEPLKPKRDMKLLELRGENTRVCINLATKALKTFDNDDEIPRKAQQKIGRYYSAMPEVLKSVCVRHFEAYTKELS